MSPRYLIFSAGLIICLVFLAAENYRTWTQPVEIETDQKVVKKPDARAADPDSAAGAPDPDSAAGAPTASLPFQNVMAISERNIFSPERKDFPSSGTGSERPVMRPAITLYGVVIANNYQSASIVQQGRPLRKGERELLTVKIGEDIGGYKLSKILPDRITLETAGDSFEVLLYDRTSPKRTLVSGTGKRYEVLPVSPSSVPAMPPFVNPPPVQTIAPRPAPMPAYPTLPPPITRRGGSTYMPPVIRPVPTPAPSPVAPAPPPVLSKENENKKDTDE